MKLMKHIFQLATSSVIGLAVFILPATILPVAAQLDEIVVTAERREANLQDVPVAVTALTPEDFETRQIENIADLQASVPSISIATNTGTASGARIFLRGVGEDESRPTADPAVGIYVDGVYLGRQTGALLDLLDLQSVEVLRGPQGTLYGRNTNGGAIKLTSKRPMPGETSSSVSFAYGDDEHIEMKASINGSLSENTAFGIAVLTKNADGHFTQEFNGADRDIGEKDLAAARLSFMHQTANDWEIFVAFDKTTDDSDPIPQTPYKGKPVSATGTETYNDIFRVVDSTDYRSTVEQQGLTFSVAGDIGNVSVKWLTGWRELEDDLEGAVGFAYTQKTDQEQMTHELIFSSNYDGRLNWVGGIYYYEEDIYLTNTFFNADTYDMDTTAQAFFGQVKFDITDATTLSGGVRYTDEEKDFIGTTTMSIFGNPDSEIGDAAPASVPAGMRAACDNWPECFYDPSGEFENTSYRIAVDHNFTDDLMAFVSYSTGFKSGGWSPDCLPNFARGACYAAVDEEELATIELGIRSEFENVRVNLTYFMNTYDDLQLAATLPGRGFTRFNVEEVEVAGLEAELSGQINEYFSWFGNASWLDTEYSEVSQATASAIA
ncbi:MAG: TonB-dependent receptor, partial [Alphaproteobacteria bacterium]|nr:TonB-dependent receptor [Alphaproteobacteria bacterium]